MRYVIYGAGAVGGVIGAALFRAGHEVCLIARGAHLDAILSRGLTVESPSGVETLPIPAAGSPAEAAITPEDVVLLAMKSQDTEAALQALEAVQPDALVVCAQNGVDNERMALRRFARVYGMLVFLPASFLQPGVVQCNSALKAGVLDVGRYPSGCDAVAEAIAAHLEGAGFSSRPSEDIMRWKHGKLLGNLINAVQAVCGPEADTTDLRRLLREEAVACLEAAGISFAGEAEMRERTAPYVKLGPIAGKTRVAGSSWQSLARGAGTIEADHLNGEIVLLGRLHGLPTPANAVLQRLANQLAAERRPPASVGVDAVMAAIDNEGMRPGVMSGA